MVRYTGRGQSSGIEMDMTSASLYRMRDGKVVTMRDYSTRAEALEAAGLEE
jgi:ketosteroid isomerase-like protein